MSMELCTFQILNEKTGGEIALKSCPRISLRLEVFILWPQNILCDITTPPVADAVSGLLSTHDLLSC